MHSLPLISHHLYVAAIESEMRPRVVTTAHESRADQARSISLEVLDGTKQMPERARELRVLEGAQRKD